jgi:hypothetical protein
MLTRGVSQVAAHTGAVEVLAGTSEGLFRLTDAGVAQVTSTETSSIAGDWAIVDGVEVVSLASGITTTTAPLSGQCVVPYGDGALVGTEQAHLFEIDLRGFTKPVDSFDQIPTRDTWYTPWGAPPDTRSLTVTSDGVALVNVHVGGVWRGDANSWTEVVPVDNDTHQVLAATSGSRVLVAAAVGFGSSTDNGRTFTWITDGLHATYSRAVALAGDFVLLTASTGPRTERGAVYRRPADSDGPFERCRDGLADWFPFNIDTFQLAASDQVAAIGTQAGEVYLSEDEGATWTLAAKDLPPVRCVAFA